MGKNYIGKMSLDASPFRDELKKIESSLKVAKNSFKEVESTSINWKNSTEDLSNVLKAQSEVVKLAKDKLEMLNKQYEWLKNSGNPSEASLRKLNEQISSQKKEVALANANLKSYQDTALDTAKNNLNLSESFNSLKLVLTELSVEIAKKAASALVDFTKETVNIGLQFETAFAGVKKVVDGTSEDFAKLQDEIRKTATEKPISADVLASLYQAGAQLGIEKDNLKDFTNAIIDLQNTSDLTAETGATMLAQYANVMHLPSEDYERFASTLSYLGSTTATTESRIMAMAQRMSGAGSSIGMTHQGLLALATAMGSVGIEAEMGGSAISTIMLNIESAVAKSNDKLHIWAETAGMTAQEFSNLWKTDVTGAIQAVLKGLSDEKAGGESLILTLEELGIKNIRQRQTMLQLSSASDMLTETINKANQEWKNNTFLTESSNAVYATTANQITLLKNSFKEVQLSIYDDLAKPLQDVTKELTEFLKSEEVAKFSKDVSKLLGDVGKTATTFIKSLIKNFDKVLLLVKTVATTVATMFATSIVSGITTKIFNIIGAFKKLQTVITATAGAQKTLNLLLNTNTIGMVISGVGLLITALLDLKLIIGDTNTAYDKQTQAILDETKALEEEKNALIQNSEARDKEIEGIDAIYNEYDDLIAELKTLVDENGNVKKGYEDRVNEIIPLLQNATGEEIRLIGNQIDGYDDLIKKLDEVIAKKRAEARINAYEGDYEGAIKGLDENAKKRKKINEQYNDLLKQSIEMEESGNAYTSIWTWKQGRKTVETEEYKALKRKRQELTNELHTLADMDKEYYQTRDEYEDLLGNYYKEYNNKGSSSGSGSSGGSGGSGGNGGSGSGGNGGSGSSGGKKKEKTESELLKEGNYTYSELEALNEKYKNDLKVYTEEMKKGNSAVTVAMVEDTKKNLDLVEKKLKDMKELLGTASTTSISSNNMFSTENDNTKEELEAKKKILKDTLSKLGTEMKNGNTAITQEMLNQINKAIDQTDAKLQTLKNKYNDISEEEEEISEEVYSDNDEIEAHATGGVIYGKGVIDKNAIEDNAAKQAQLEASAYREAELQIQEQQLLVNANQDALNKQMAVLDPSNLEIYDTTNRLLAEQEQISHAAGLNDNAYKVVDAELTTLNQAKQMALTIDFTSIGQYICQGIANGINANKYLVIDAVKTMMEEANEAAEDKEEIDSPSKVFAKYGYYIDKGLEIGIKENANGPLNNIRDMMASMNSVAAGKLSGLGENVSHTIKGINSDFNGNNPNNGISKSQVNYTFNQYNTSNKSLDVLSIYKESRSLLKRTIRNQYV